MGNQMCRAMGCLPVTVKKVVCNLETIKNLWWQILLWLDFQSWIFYFLTLSPAFLSQDAKWGWESFSYLPKRISMRLKSKWAWNVWKLQTIKNVLFHITLLRIVVTKISLLWQTVMYSSIPRYQCHFMDCFIIAWYKNITVPCFITWTQCR